MAERGLPLTLVLPSIPLATGILVEPMNLQQSRDTTGQAWRRWGQESAT